MVAESFVKLPPLESGGRLTRTEFERRYSAMPHVKKAELIEGVVYLATYQPLATDAEGTFRSQQFPGLWLAGDLLLAGNLAGVLDGLQRGLATPEHQTFVRQL